MFLALERIYGISNITLSIKHARTGAIPQFKIFSNDSNKLKARWGNMDKCGTDKNVALMQRFSVINSKKQIKIDT